MTDETRARFIMSIAAQLPAERVAELHIFSAIRQGGVESGIAVIAVEREAPVVDLVAADAPVIEEPVVPELALDVLPEGAPVAVAAARFTIFTARYRHTLKGLDRGKWEVNVVEEADAPLLTLDAVIRGVQRRSGDADEILRLSGDEFRALLPAT